MAASSEPRPSTAFSFRSSLGPAFSIQRPKNVVPKLPAEHSILGSPPQLPPLNTNFLGSESKFSITTMESGSFSPVSVTKDLTVSLLSVNARSAQEAEAEAEAAVRRTVQPEFVTALTFAKTSENMGNTPHQRGGDTSCSDASKALVVDAKSNTVSGSLCSSPTESRSTSPNSTTASSVSSYSPTKSNVVALFSVSSKSHNSSPPAKLRLARSNTTSKRPRGLSIFMKNSPQTTEDPPLPPAVGSTEHISTSSSNSANFKKVKDEMLDAYKLLEADYQKFKSKSGAQKTNIVRQSLLPFLRKHQDKSSRNVPPEYLEKRTQILHHWWTGLLSHIQNRGSETVSSADKSTCLEALSYILSRPEWRTAPSTFAPLSERLPMSGGSSTSLSSASSNFSVQRSVQHNIKVLFTRALLETLTYVVDRLALRSISPALVAFGGKLIAYVFYFCPGAAEMLIGIWGLQPAFLRRVLPELGDGRNTDLRQFSDEVVCEFPEALHSLGFTTLTSLIRQIKRPAKPPIGIQVDWYGPWMSRWCGRDSELLFVFFKHYHILMCDYLAHDTTYTARMCSPGYVPVLAQMLSLVDSTIHRNLGPGGAELATSSTTFEDLLNASSTHPLPDRHPARAMADNKLVILLQDILFTTNCSQTCREYFATSFTTVLKAAAQRTQLYDSDACFQLCGLVEELLPILERAGKQGIGEFIDWKFWLQVAQTMLQSENNMTELRAISFVYTIWDILVEDEDRKKTVCLEWLLSPPIWERFFCHWCPIVRAYYMRLLCWRLGRYDGSPTEVDVEILKTMLLRLRTGYAHHVQIRKNFEIFGTKPSSTTPCLPAPNRRLVILRNDVISASQGVLLDGIIPTSIPFVATPGSLLRTHSTASLASLEACSETSSDSRSDETGTTATGRKWNQLRSVFGFKTGVATEKKPEPTTPPKSSGGSSPSGKSQQQRRANFKFSLEWIDRPMYGRDRILGLSRLPAPAQRFLESIESDIPTVEASSATINAKHWTYIGRALAEWILVIVEYESFVDRRKAEGREADKDVETPSLGVDSMRKF